MTLHDWIHAGLAVVGIALIAAGIANEWAIRRARRRAANGA